MNKLRFIEPVSVKEADHLLDVLRSALRYGLPLVEGRRSSWTDLSWWKRAINWLPIWDRPPFVDTANFERVTLRPLDSNTQAFVRTALIKLAPIPACNRCGGTNLAADPSGYYWDAMTSDGAPLLCLDHDD